ncbi:uncharacterized protein LOC128653467 isoform X2 [Bombina bombina]|uniref:uncharacterized protein LOC128653467 isoform X2 n=1 Tax=Bombina bombina TaxID=8345 RepID=UPI00235A710E|nr:uncharacterized protein LOC128653467 isoform X2 [Bombina bombina]
MQGNRGFMDLILHITKVFMWCFLMNLFLATGTEQTDEKCKGITLKRNIDHLQDLIDSAPILDCHMQVKWIAKGSVSNYSYLIGNLYYLPGIIDTFMNFAKNTRNFNHKEDLKKLLINGIDNCTLMNEDESDYLTKEDLKLCRPEQSLTYIEILQMIKDLLIQTQEFLKNPIKQKLDEMECNEEETSSGSSQCDCPSPIPPIHHTTPQLKPPETPNSSEQPGSHPNTAHSTMDTSVSVPANAQHRLTRPQQTLQSPDVLPITFTEMSTESYTRLNLLQSCMNLLANTASPYDSKGVPQPDMDVEKVGSETLLGIATLLRGTVEPALAKTEDQQATTNQLLSNTKVVDTDILITKTVTLSNENSAYTNKVTNKETLLNTTESPLISTDYTAEKTFEETSEVTGSYVSHTGAENTWETETKMSDLGWASSYYTVTKIRRSLPTSNEISQIQMTATHPPTSSDLGTSSAGSPDINTRSNKKQNPGKYGDRQNTSNLYIVIPFTVIFLLCLCGFLYYFHNYRKLKRQQRMNRRASELIEERPLQELELEEV